MSGDAAGHLPVPTLNEGAALADECARIVRCLVGVEPGRDLVERYRQAHVDLFPDPPSSEDRALLQSVRRHGWSLPLLDAAAGLVAPDSRLRRKILLVVALLETDPAFAARFEPERLWLPGLVARLVLAGISALAKAAAGLVVYAVLIKRGRARGEETETPAAGAAGRA